MGLLATVNCEEVMTEGEFNGSKRLLIDPMENIIIGSQLIRQYLGISSVATMYEWYEIYGLPLIKRPDGQWMTSISAIDQWIFMGAEADIENRPLSRGNSKRADIALIKAKRRVDRIKSGADKWLMQRIVDPDAGEK